MTYTFGRFTFHSTGGRLEHEGAPLTLSERQRQVLFTLLQHAGTIVAKETLVKAAWDDVAVTDNSVEQAVSVLRRTLAVDPALGPAIETVPRQGYRFSAPVTRQNERLDPAQIDVLLAPHRAWVEGRAALETLSADEVARAENAFRSVVVHAPDLIQGHLGLANALAFRFESTRADAVPDVAALRDALECARAACRIDPDRGEAWATLGFVLHRSGRVDEGSAAVRRALMLEGDNWRHHLRLAFVTWGEERLRAALRTLQLMPGLALAYWLAASVHVARQGFETAGRLLEAGVRAQDGQADGASRFLGVGLHWLRGLVQWQLGDDQAARVSFERELAQESRHHLYTRECCAQTWYALGAWHFRRGDAAAAADAFEESLRRVSGHPLPLAARFSVGLRASAEAHAMRLAYEERMASVRDQGGTTEAAMADALIDAVAGRHAQAARRVQDALQGAPLGPAGWLLPVDPFLRIMEHAEQWQGVLVRLRDRAA
ncbi:MAG: winged helix-turn-helix domain-containing protein [Vicinamibacterales bacterium]